MANTVEFINAVKRFGDVTAVDGVSFSIAGGETVALLGPSGCGKTTILRIIAGFERPDSGSVRIAGEDVTQLRPYQRNVGLLFQHYALFPHMTIAENVAFPLKMRGIGRAERDARVTKALDLVRLGHLKDRKPSQLSGGQQQRIALSRALVYEPKVVLMDEPLSALDKQLREHMQLEIRELHRKLGLTVIFVTHDQGEALTMSDRVAVLNLGKIEQLDTPSGLYDRPRTRFVAEFIGETNLLDGTLKSCSDGLATVELALGPTVSCRTELSPKPSAPVLVSVRPERLHLSDAPTLANSLPVRVEDDVYHGDHVRLHLKSGERRLVAKADRREASRPIGSSAHVGFAPDDCTLVLP